MRAPGGYAIWCDRTGRLFRTDGGGMQLWAWTPATGQRQSWRMPEPLCCFALTASRERLLLALASRLAFLDLTTGLPARICEVASSTLPSDGRCDRQGRFVFGSAGIGKNARGAFWRLNHDLSLERLPLEDVGVAGSICFSPNGRTLYYADAAQEAIRCCDYHPCSGEITRPRLFVDAGAGDGSAVDAEGGLWTARRGAMQLHRIAADGSSRRSVRLEMACAGWPVFGGADVGTLYLPGADGIVEMAPGVHGLAEQRFLGRLPSR